MWVSEGLASSTSIKPRNLTSGFSAVRLPVAGKDETVSGHRGAPTICAFQFTPLLLPLTIVPEIHWGGKQQTWKLSGF